MANIQAICAFLKQCYFFARWYVGAFFGLYISANQLTWFRMICAVLLVPLWLFGDSATRYTIIALWAVCWACDWLDGAVADATSTRSDFGKWFDPLADKVQFYIPAALFVYSFTWVPFILAFLLDTYSTMKRGFGGGGIAGGTAKDVVGANWYGKWKTGCQVIFFFMSALAFADDGQQGYFEMYAYNIGQAALWTAIGLSFVSLFFRTQYEA